MFRREVIMEQIQRTAAENGGSALGSLRFEAETGIRVADWRGRYWARWNDAVVEAGCEPNQMKRRYDDDTILDILKDEVRRLGKGFRPLPSNGCVALKTRPSRRSRSAAACHDGARHQDG